MQKLKKTIFKQYKILNKKILFNSIKYHKDKQIKNR